MDFRIAVGWRKFWALRRLLLNSDVSVKKRLRLFDSSIGSSVLWGTRSWTPRVDEFRKLRVAQNMMMRRICGFRRCPDELWLDWMLRTTGKARSIADDAGVRDWVGTHARYKWAWAGHVARRDSSSWLWRVSTWRDYAWNHLSLEVGSCRPLRPSRWGWMKWEDPIRRFSSCMLGSSWCDCAQDRAQWSRECDSFAKWLAKR